MTVRGPLGANRRTRAIRLLAALGVGFIVSSFVPHAAGGDEDDFIPGSGQAYAQIYRVGPTAGKLSLAPIFGLSLADYLNTVGRGEAKVADWAGIGVAERSLPDNTPSLKVSSTQKDADKGVTEYAGGQSDGTNGGGFGEMYARATKAPLGESRYRTGSLGIPGLIEARDNEASTSAGIVSNAKGQVREATAETKIGTLNIADGLVVLKGLHWKTVQQTGAIKSIKGSFTVEGVTLGGIPLPLPGGPSELETVLDPINGALAQTGFAISLPEFEARSGQGNVSPLSLDIADSPAGRQYLAPLLEALHPVREPVTGSIIDLAKALKEEMDKQFAAADDPNDDESPREMTDLTVAVLAADLAVGIFSGSSQLHLEFGGVSAFTEGERFKSPFGVPGFKPQNLGTPPQTIVTPGTPGTPPVPGAGPSEVEGEFASAPLGPGSRTVPGDRGGVAAIVGLIGLAVAIGLAAADWYRMRASRQMAGSAVS